MNNPYLKFILLLILFITLQISKIFAQHCYIYEGQRWQTGFVTYHINSILGNAFATQAEYETAIIAAAASWSNAGAYFEFIKGNNVDYERGQEPAGIFQVGKFYEFLGGLGVTDINLNPNNPNEIIKACTYFNTYYFFTTEPDFTEYDIQSNILHEFGHWLRLGDEEDINCYDNVMYEGLPAGEIKRNLTQDDKNGIAFIYGQNPATPLEVNKLLNKQHYFFDYEPEILLYSQKKTGNTVNYKKNSAQGKSFYSEKIPKENKIERVKK